MQHLNLHFQFSKDFIYAILSQTDDSKKSKNSFLSQKVFVMLETAVRCILLNTVVALKL